MFGGTAPTALELSPLLYPRRPKKYTHLPPPPPTRTLHSPSRHPSSHVPVTTPPRSPPRSTPACPTTWPSRACLPCCPSATAPPSSSAPPTRSARRSAASGWGRAATTSRTGMPRRGRRSLPSRPALPSVAFFFRFFSFLAWPYLLARERARPWGRLHPDTHSSHPPPPHLPSFLFSLSLQPPSSRAPSRAAPRNLS